MNNTIFQNFNQKVSTALIFTGILYSIIGILGLINPIAFSVYLIYILAFFFLVNGFNNFVKGIKFTDVPGFHWTLSIFLGAIEILLALSLFFTPFISQIYMIIYAGIFLIIKGIFILVNVISHKKLFPNLYSHNLGSGVIDLLFGILLLFLPIFSQQFLFLAVAWYILFCGINLIISSIALKKINK